MENRKSFAETRAGLTVLATLCCLLWGSAIPFINLGYRYFAIPSGETASQIVFAGCRFFLAGIVTLIIRGLTARRLPLPVKKKGWVCACKLAMVQTVIQYLFFYQGVANTESMKASIILGIGPFVSIVTACYLYRTERMTVWKWIGGLIGIAGILLINLKGTGFDLSMTFTGEGFLLLSLFASACSAVMIRSYGQENDPVTLNGWQFALGGAVMILIGLLSGGHLHAEDPRGIAVLLYLVVVSSVAYSVWGILLKAHPVSHVTVFIFLQPIFGAALALLFFGQESSIPPLRAAIALVLICVSIILVGREKKEKA